MQRFSICSKLFWKASLSATRHSIFCKHVLYGWTLQYSSSSKLKQFQPCRARCGFFIFAVHSTCPAAELNLLIYNSKERFPLETAMHFKTIGNIIFILQRKQVITKQLSWSPDTLSCKTHSILLGLQKTISPKSGTILVQPAYPHLQC